MQRYKKNKNKQRILLKNISFNRINFCHNNLVFVLEMLIISLSSRFDNGKSKKKYTPKEEFSAIQAVKERHYLTLLREP